jgi:hypothetical protein
MIPDKFVIRGVKKAFALTRIKLGLAEDFGTDFIGFNNEPLELVQLFSKEKVGTLEEGKELLEELRKGIDLGDPDSIAKAFIQMMEVIEGAKQEFEPRQEPYIGHIDERRAKILDAQVREKGGASILLFCEDTTGKLDFYTGSNPPKGGIPLGATPSASIFLLQFAFKNDYLSDGLMLKNITSVLGHKTVLIDAMHFSLVHLGADF